MLQELNQINLNDTWYFSPGHVYCDEDPNYVNGNRVEWHEIEVPYCWNGSKWMTVVGDFYRENGYYKDHQIPPFKDHQGVGWYKKEIVLTDKWYKKRVYIHFAGVSAKAKLWVNGKEVGEHLGAYSSFQWDITDFLHINGEKETLIIKVWDKSCFFPSDDSSFQQHKVNTKVIGRRTLIPVGETRNNGGIDQPVHLFATENTYVEDIDIKTNENGFSARVHIDRKEMFGSTYTLRARIIDLENQDIVYESIKHTQIPEETMSFLFRGNNLKVNQWWPHAPHLYRFEVSIIKDNVDYGNFFKDIGFKTFTIKNSKFYLNGEPYFLRGAGSPPHTMILHDEAYINKFMTYCREYNINCIRFHTEPPSQKWLDACDKYGMLVIYEMPLMQQAPDPINTRHEFTHMVKAVKHHPSLAIYCLSNELDHFSNIVDPIGYSEHHVYLSDLEEAVREADDTLPVYNNAGFRDPRTCADIKDIHSYSGWYGKAIIAFEKALRNVKIHDDDAPLSSLYFEKWQKEIEIDNHKPLIITEFIGAYTNNEGRFYQIPASKRFIGNDPDKNNERALWYQAHLIEESVEIFRRERNDYNNLSGFAPFALFNWFFNPLSTENIHPKPAAKVLKKVLEPLHISIRCHHKRIFNNNDFKAELHLIHDDVRYKTLNNTKITYKICSAQQIIYQHVIQVDSIHYYNNKIVPITIPVALTQEQLEEGHLQFEVVWLDHEDHVLSTNSTKVQVFEIPGTVMYKQIINLYDPDGSVEGILTTLGYETNRVNTFDSLKANDRLVIGSNTIPSLETTQIEQLQIALRRGIHLLILEQNLYEMSLDEISINWIDETPLRIVKEGRGTDDYVYVKDNAHAIFNRLTKEDFRDWNGDTILISSYIQQGDESRHVPAKTKLGSRFGYRVNKYAHVTSHIECSNFLKNDGLIELNMGRGKILFNQLEACRRYGDDPVATLYLNNLIDYFMK